MEVILRQHVDNLGRRGEIVKVADGYARNYLLPRKLALLATEGNKKQIEREPVEVERIGSVLHEGTVICEGTVEKVQSDERVREIYLGRHKVHG